MSRDGGTTWKRLTGHGLPTTPVGKIAVAIAESPREKGVIWAGTNDGLLHVTRDNGATWTNVTANIPNLPPGGRSATSSHRATSRARPTSRWTCTR